MGEFVTIKAAAERLGVSPDTVRRRLRSGDLQGEKRGEPQGATWYVELPDDAPPAPVPGTGDATAGDGIELVRLRAELAGAQALIDELRNDRDAWREQAARHEQASEQLRVLVQQAQALAGALPAGGGAGPQAYVPPMPLHEQADVADGQPAKRAVRVFGFTISR